MKCRLVVLVILAVLLEPLSARVVQKKSKKRQFSLLLAPLLEAMAPLFAVGTEATLAGAGTALAGAGAALAGAGASTLLTHPHYGTETATATAHVPTTLTKPIVVTVNGQPTPKNVQCNEHSCSERLECASKILKGESVHVPFAYCSNMDKECCPEVSTCDGLGMECRSGLCHDDEEVSTTDFCAPAFVCCEQKS